MPLVKISSAVGQAHDFTGLQEFPTLYTEPHPVATFSVALWCLHTHQNWLSTPRISSIPQHMKLLIEFHQISEPEGACRAYYPTFSFNSWGNKIYSWELFDGRSHYLQSRLNNRQSLTAAREAMKQRDALKGAEMRNYERGFPGSLVLEVQLHFCLQTLWDSSGL